MLGSENRAVPGHPGGGSSRSSTKPSVPTLTKDAAVTTSGTPADVPTPTALTVHQQSRVLEIHFSDGIRFSLPFELLRVNSPSAEVKGHGPGQEVLQTGKRMVGIVDIEPVGHYGIRPSFDDGHDTGIFTWAYLYDVGLHQDALWRDYAERLQAAGVDRDAPMAVAAGSHCAH
jgi:DUF971 family protein